MTGLTKGLVGGFRAAWSGVPWKQLADKKAAGRRVSSLVTDPVLWGAAGLGYGKYKESQGAPEGSAQNLAIAGMVGGLLIGRGSEAMGRRLGYVAGRIGGMGNAAQRAARGLAPGTSQLAGDIRATKAGTWLNTMYGKGVNRGPFSERTQAELKKAGELLHSKTLAGMADWRVPQGLTQAGSTIAGGVGGMALGSWGDDDSWYGKGLLYGGMGAVAGFRGFGKTFGEVFGRRGGAGGVAEDIYRVANGKTMITPRSIEMIPGEGLIGYAQSKLGAGALRFGGVTDYAGKNLSGFSRSTGRLATALVGGGALYGLGSGLDMAEDIVFGSEADKVKSARRKRLKKLGYM